MGSKRCVRARSCGDKIRHKTEADALTQIASLRAGGELGPLKAYHCRFCKFWHVGHRSRRNRQ